MVDVAPTLAYQACGQMQMGTAAIGQAHTWHSPSRVAPWWFEPWPTGSEQYTSEWPGLPTSHRSSTNMSVVRPGNGLIAVAAV